MDLPVPTSVSVARLVGQPADEDESRLRGRRRSPGLAVEPVFAARVPYRGFGFGPNAWTRTFRQGPRRQRRARRHENVLASVEHVGDRRRAVQRGAHLVAPQQLARPRIEREQVAVTVAREAAGSTRWSECRRATASASGTPICVRRSPDRLHGTRRTASRRGCCTSCCAPPVKRCPATYSGL